MSSLSQPVTLHPLAGLPMVEPGDRLDEIVGAALTAAGIGLQDGDVVVVAQKIVSKAEGRYVSLDAVTPSAPALELAARTGKDPRHVEIVLSESDEVVKTGPNLIIVAHRLGFVMANAGVDVSNIAQEPGEARVLLLPRDPDGSAARLKQALDQAFGVSCGVVVNDSFGRPWRNGVVGVALGAAGLPTLISRVGQTDLFGRPLTVTEIGVGDEIASAASLLMGQAAEGIPVVVVRGLRFEASGDTARTLVRDKARDLFR